MAKAHQLDAKLRTQDVAQGDAANFADLLLSEPVLAGLSEAGYRTPSPIQLKAIPLGRCGLDLVVQSKAGTGKTCVFAVLALESLAPDFANNHRQGEVVAGVRVLALSPTREVALQSRRAIETIGQRLAGLRCGLFIGGLGAGVKEAEAEAAACQVAVGTPGRVRQLIEAGCLKTDRVRMLVLDEADALLNESFQQDINCIYWKLPQNKQVLALSATYPDSMAQQLSMYMRDPTLVRLSGGQLLGVRLYWRSVPDSHLPNLVLERKARILGDLLAQVQFGQCLVFSNYQERARELCQRLEAAGWPVAYLAGRLQQSERIGAYDRLRDFRCRVLVATDVAARGVDAENVDLVVNLDLPRDHRTLLHRIGRAGRFGSYAAAVSLVGDGPELRQLHEFERLAGLRMSPLPEPPPSDLANAPPVGDSAAAAASFIEVVADSDDNSDDVVSVKSAAPTDRSMFESDSPIRPPRPQKQSGGRSGKGKQKFKRGRQHRQEAEELPQADDADDWAAFEASAGAAAASSSEDAEVLRLRALLHGGAGSSSETAPQPQVAPPAPQPQVAPPAPQPAAPAPIASADFSWIAEESSALAGLLSDWLDGASGRRDSAAKMPADMLEARRIIDKTAAANNRTQKLPLELLLLPDSTAADCLPADRLLALNKQIQCLACRSSGHTAAPTEPTSAPTEPASAPAVPASAPAGPASAPATTTAAAAVSSDPLSPSDRQLLHELLAADAELEQLRQLVDWHRQSCEREWALMEHLRQQLYEY
ncbi:hypothetical protein BOX15_Mlig020686g1 [Macrostomum lignano]|uniref:RNA helicase n=2 Tax=Macrostomum lignano TaxID=282301 RepID=A0A267G6I3_9PLAT|nr:hypothetical protein BOX15_Mlig020686g1 [Macrostomum lignano]